MSTLQRMAEGAIIQYTREGFRCAGRFVSEPEVAEYIKRGWACPTMKFGGSLTGRVVITQMGKRAALLRVECAS